MTSYPDYDRIVAAAKKEVEAKDAMYNSMWTTRAGKDWWITRLLNEVKEAEASQTPPEERRKYVNILNLAAMAWEMRDGNEPAGAEPERYVEAANEAYGTMLHAATKLFEVALHAHGPRSAVTSMLKDEAYRYAELLRERAKA